jgi:hypothetical protein
LVEELAGVLWRKRRLRLAEAAAHRRGLSRALDWSRTTKAALVHLENTGEADWAADAIRATSTDTADEIRDMQEDEAVTNRAIKLLGSRRNDAYEAALALLRENTQEWWASELARKPNDSTLRLIFSAVSPTIP